MEKRRRIRLRYWDYRAGAYFVTICARGRRTMFGRLRETDVVLGSIGSVVAEHLTDRLGALDGVCLDAWIVMPDHVHAVVMLDSRRSLAAVIGSFKSATTRDLMRRGWLDGPNLWQRGYYEHVVRNDADLNRIRQYIVNNPIRVWHRRGIDPFKGS